MTALIAASVAFNNAAEAEQVDLLGDADSDSVITSSDALIILRSSLDDNLPVELSVYDVDRDKAVTANDGMLVLRSSIGLDDGYAIGLPIYEGKSDINGLRSYDGYTLDQVVVLSRHNIRSPLSAAGSALDTITPHEWFTWSSGTSELSLRGGILETNMGQYFKRWLEKEGLFPSNYHPSENEVRIYSNSKQRTIATANFFSTGLLPTANVDVEYHMEFDKMDPVFTPQLTFVTDEYRKDAEAQIRELFTDDIEQLADNYRLLEDTIDVKESSDWQNGKFDGFKTDDTVFVLDENAEPGMKGSLKTACSVSDALVLQYYEESDPHKAGFGHDLTFEQWQQISEIKDVYGDVLFTAPDIAVNVAHPLLVEIEKEIKTDGRKFTFLCGHDSNVGSVLAALDTEDYSLPYSVEKKTPIGCKLVFCTWKNDSNEEFISVDLVYQTVNQLRGISLLDVSTPPMSVPMSFNGLEKNSDGLYKASDLLGRFDDSIERYYELAAEYGVEPAA